MAGLNKTELVIDEMIGINYQIYFQCQAFTNRSVQKKVSKKQDVKIWVAVALLLLCCSRCTFRQRRKTKTKSLPSYLSLLGRSRTIHRRLLQISRPLEVHRSPKKQRLQDLAADLGGADQEDWTEGCGTGRGSSRLDEDLAARWTVRGSDEDWSDGWQDGFQVLVCFVLHVLHSFT